MLKQWRHSLYFKIFLSFLATCILFFVALAIFWNYFFSDFIYKEKKADLQNHTADIRQIYRNYESGTYSIRDVNISIRLIARSFNGQVWIVDPKGQLLFNSSSELNRSVQIIPPFLRPQLQRALKNESGFTINQFYASDSKQSEDLLTFYTSLLAKDKPAAIFFYTPVDNIDQLVSVVRLNIVLPLLFSLIAVGIILFSLSRKFTGPLQQMNRAALALADGDFLTQVNIHSRDEIGQLAQSFNFMVEQLKQWEDTRQEFLANISHELRSPLTTLRGLIHGMNDDVIPPSDHSHYLEICDHEVQRLQRLVSELLDLARIQNSPDVFHLKPVHVIGKTQSVIHLLAPSIEAQGLKLEVWIPEDHSMDPMVALDEDRYAQILYNLISNATQFTPSGKKLLITLRIESARFVVIIEDEGIGMSEEEIKRIWERFYKANPGRGHVSGGTGLGLTIVRHLVLGMRGTISVSSIVGQGSKFVIRFPLI